MGVEDSNAAYGGLRCLGWNVLLRLPTGRVHEGTADAFRRNVEYWYASKGLCNYLSQLLRSRRICLKSVPESLHATQCTAKEKAPLESNHYRHLQ